MENWLTITLILPILLSSKTLPKTEAIIFGTVHRATENFDLEDGLNILKKMNPDVILFEHPISWNAEEFCKLVPKIENPTLETIMVKKYLDENSSVLLRYYDIANRNKYYIETRYFEQLKPFLKELDDFIEKNKKNDSLPFLKERIAIHLKHNKLNETLLQEYPRIINSATADSICAIKNRDQHNNYIKFTEIIPELKNFNEFIISLIEYWNKRNKAMVKNIIKYATEFQGKRIIVINGFQHRYYLRKELQQSQKQNFVVKEYWKYE